MIAAIELQVISKILLSDNDNEVEALLSYSPDLYFNALKQEIEFIHEHKAKYNTVPSIFEFNAQFPDVVTLQDVSRVPLEFLETKLKEYRRYLLLMETFNKIKDLGEGDVDTAWKYLEMQAEKASNYDDVHPMDIIKEAPTRADQIKEYSKQKRIPTGFAEIDKVMYGGLSTVEELLVLIARTNAGKSWVCVKMLESAQANNFPCAYYSPEMQAAYLATRFDTWRQHFENNKLYKGEYSPEYLDYINKLASNDTCPAYIIEDKDFPNGVSVRSLAPFVRKHGIKLLIVDGISYMQDDNKATRDQEKYKNIALGLFQLSKKYGCAVVLVMQANREVRSKDSDKGESIPDLFNAEGSDQPARIATQAFGIRQVFEDHILDIKLLKSRMANNQNPVFSYLWSINEGKLSYIENDETSNPDSSGGESSFGKLRPISFGTNQPDSNDLSLINGSEETNSNDDESFDDVEF